MPTAPAVVDTGYSVDQLITWLGQCERSIPETTWRKNALEDYRFYAGKQDTPEVLLELADLKRPNSTYNEILPKINMLHGLAAQTKHDPYLTPVGSEDEALAELLQGVLKHYRNKLKISRKELECFFHTITSGRSLLHFYMDTSNPFSPSIKANRVQGYNFSVDSNSKEYDLSDARYAFIDKWLSEDDILSQWPDADISKLQTFGSSYHETTGYNYAASAEMPLFYNQYRELYRLVEAWYYKYVKVVWFVNPLSNKPENLPPEMFREFSNAFRNGFDYQGQRVQLPKGQDIQSIDGYLKEYYYSIFSGSEVKEGGKSPYKYRGFPMAYYGAYHDEDDNTWFGVVKQLKDPQRSKNTMKRQLSHLLQTLPKGLLAHEAGAILNMEEYETRSADPSFHLEVAPGALEKFKFVAQPQISPIYAQFDQDMTVAMKDISGIQNELMGAETSSRTPGVTVKARQETSLSVLYSLYDNFKESRINGDKILLSLIQQYTTQEQIIRIEGNDGASLIQVNSQLNPQMPGFNDITAGEFDIVVSETTETATQRAAMAGIMTDYNQNNPGSIPAELILEYADAPYTLKQKVAAFRQQAAESSQAEADRNYELELLKIGVKAGEIRSKASLAEEQLKVDARQAEVDAKQKVAKPATK